MKSPESRVIADIARDRESKTSPRMNSDDTDQESLRWSGMRSRNLFVFLIEAWGWDHRDRRHRRHRA
jgi:hypothetical protein